MKKVEIIVGLFVLSGLVGLFFLAFRVGKSEFIGEKTYELTAIFNNLSGVSENGRVEIAGVRVGSIKNIELDENFQAIVILTLPVYLKLDDDTIAAVKTSGLIGDRFIELLPGGSGIQLESGDLIIDTQSAIDLESLISKFGFGDLGNIGQ
ncbi:MAG: outer membrane lipid asymmetry maintenance protein MlaD [Opitutae bacterium]|jgi:phospholipid/cholesterol/gamma-HCH transport system substrate-binding protein|nr:outer membrane lipid asymmetry maintenance protein MlaD [Opitutae bacterium]